VQKINTCCWLIGRNGKVLTFVAQNIEAETFHQIIDNNVSNEAVIVTAAYKSYVGLNKKCNHIIVKHDNGGYVVKVGG
jgi:hypothetical protein